jgi:hypothetical protein
MQRNVGILENIVASMTTSSSSSSGSSRAKGAELLAQYEAQVDVLEHLGRKVQRLLEGGGGGGSSGGRSGGAGTARTKLARDFERVKAQAANLQERVARFQRATAAASASANFSGAPSSSSSSGPDHYHQQVQLQLQQDVRFSWRRWRPLFSCCSTTTGFYLTCDLAPDDTRCGGRPSLVVAP